MSRSPVLLVLKDSPPAGLTDALRSAGFSYREVSGNEAAQLAGTAQLVVCERIPGWQALVARIDGAGGASVLWGPPLQALEHKGLVPNHLEVVSDVAAIAPALERAQFRLQSNASQLQVVSQRLLERIESAERISRFAQSIATHIDLPQVIHEAVARTRDLCEADGASLFLVDPGTGDLCFNTVVGGMGEPIESIRLKPGQGIAGKVAVEATPWLVSDVRQNPDFDPRSDEASGFATGSIIAAPLLLSGDVIGVLEAVRSVDRPSFQKHELRRLEDLAPHVTIAVHNAQMTEMLREMQEQIVGANLELEQKVQTRTRQIQDAKREWERTFDAISEPIALQEGFTLRRVNLAYARRLGLPIAEIPGKICHQIFANRDSPCPGCPMLSGRGGELTGEVEMKGQSRFLFSGFWMSSDSSDVRVVAHYRDVTKQRVLEERLRESERLAALGQLAAGAAHEINNPLGFLTSNLNSLRDGLEELREIQDASAKALTFLRKGQTQEAQRALEPIEELDGEGLLRDGSDMIAESLEGARRVGDIVRALRELSRFGVERGDPCAVNASVARVVRAEFGEHSPSVVVELHAQRKAQIPPLQMDQALGHLLRNARQAVTGDQKVWVRTEDLESQILIEVRDEGCGISPENLRRIFEPFFTTRAVGQGIGLGLTAAYGIIKRNGGTIDVQSTVGKGTTVTVKLPPSRIEEEAASLSSVKAEA